MSDFIGITREPVFSPGKVADDRAVLEMVAEHLRQLGATVSVCSGAQDRWPTPKTHAIVFAMCQGDTALRRLQEWQAQGIRIINSPDAVLNCQRHRTVPALTQAGVPFPKSVLIRTDEGITLPPWVTGCDTWIKRGDVHATQPDDVVAAHGVADVQHAIARFRARGIRSAVVQQHVHGEVVKFYAVRDQFFHAVPLQNGTPMTGVTTRALAELGAQAARVLGVEVYGGDCVCDVTGGLQIIDLNDWPSYARCRAEAARAIAAYLHAQRLARNP